jgi:hypothetical protein
MKPIYEYSVYYFLVAKHLLPRQNLENEKKGCCRLHSCIQAIAVGKKSFDKSPIFQIGTANISCDEVVKLLGVDIDYMLKFDCHIKNICNLSCIFSIFFVSY